MTARARLARLEARHGAGPLERDLPPDLMLAWASGERHDERERYPRAWRLHLAMWRGLLHKPDTAG